MAKTLNRIECDPKCGFIVQSEDREEAIDILKRHAKAKHKMDPTPEQIKGWLKTVSI